jgi:hypothetical protein
MTDINKKQLKTQEKITQLEAKIEEQVKGSFFNRLKNICKTS